jgi:ElaB/YqjD/DUF883 family membrane-anchored ribosome-binding protein
MDDSAEVIEQQIDETLASLTEKLSKLEQKVSGTVKTVKDSVMTVRDTFDLKRQVRRRPWTLVAGATALGILGGLRTNGRNTINGAQNGKSANTLQAELPAGQHARSNTNGSLNRESEKLSWLAKLGQSLEPEIAELKGIAIGTLIGVFHEMLKSSAKMQTARPKDES